MTTASRDLIYLDHAATTPVAPEVADAMRPHLSGAFGNAGASHRLGRQARVALEAARSEVARSLSCDPDEVVFTSGGTEANNLAVAGALEGATDGGTGGAETGGPAGAEIGGMRAPASGPQGGAVPAPVPAPAGTVAGRTVGYGPYAAVSGPPNAVVSAIEHVSVLAAAERWAALRRGERRLVGVDRLGRVRSDELAVAVDSSTTLVAIMLANNEVGTIQPVGDIAGLVHSRGALLHVDAVQAAAWIDIDVGELGADTLSISAHKTGGPKGVGALFVRRGTPVRAQIVGGGQEHGFRSGTENVAGAVGLAAALRLARERRAEAPRVAALGQALMAGLLSIDGVRLTGHHAHRLPSIVSVCVLGVPADLMLLGLDASGICASSGSACASGLLEPSHVLTAMGIDETQARSALRFSLGHGTTEGEIERVLDVMPGLVPRLREATQGG